MSRVSERIAAIEAIAGGRIDDAVAILQQLQQEPRPVQRGVCRMCGCSEARGCGILVDTGPEWDPSVIRCGWADAEATVCTNVSCLERWRRESPAELDVDVHDIVQGVAPQSRIVLP